MVLNNPSKAGKRAGRAKFYGDNSRFAVYPVHTRFDAVAWFVADAENLDEFGLPSVVAQCGTAAAANDMAKLYAETAPGATVRNGRPGGIFD